MANNSSSNDKVIHPQVPPPKAPDMRPPGNLDHPPPVLGQGTYGVVHKVQVGKFVYAARKTITIFVPRRPEDAPELKAAWEHGLMVKARKENAPNVVYALPPPTVNVNIEPGEYVEEKPYIHGSLIKFDMEWAQMGNLREFIANNPSVRINHNTVCWIARQAFWGLDWLHGQNILHGDLKTENLLLFSGKYEPISN